MRQIMTSRQLILFEETREDILEHRIQMLEQQLDKIRKNLFAKYTELMQMALEQKEILDALNNQPAA